MYSGCSGHTVLYLAVLAFAVTVAASSKDVSQTQCGVIGEAEFCEKTLCYITLVNTTCDDDVGNVTETPAPACDTVYYVSFVASFGNSLFMLYESPERQLNGYASMRDALEYAGSVKPLTDCKLVNETAYSTVSKAKSSKSSGSQDDAILGIVIAALAVIAIAIVAAIVVVIVIAIAMVYRSHKKSRELATI